MIQNIREDFSETKKSPPLHQCPHQSLYLNQCRHQGPPYINVSIAVRPSPPYMRVSISIFYIRLPLHHCPYQGLALYQLLFEGQGEKQRLCISCRPGKILKLLVAHGP